MARRRQTNPIPETEVEAYVFIRDQLRNLGWNVGNPSRYASGRLWVQNQCLAHPEIKRCLGTTRPENIVKLSETKLWVIEAKRDRAQLNQALRESQDDYAKPLREGGFFAVPLITGVAGNDFTKYEVRTRLWVKDRYEPVTINNREATGLLDPAMVEILLTTGNPNIADYQVNKGLFLKTAEAINRTLHNGGINKLDRSRLMAALLLALLEDTPSVESELPVLIDDINTRTRAVLRKHGKLAFHPFVVIQPPTNSENHVKYKAALIQTIHLLNALNIKSAMNSGADVLGEFYEVFLKYGNGAKEIGIVLTPRHITRFAVEVVGVSHADIVLDPACGTGGFLVAAFDHVRTNSSATQRERFRLHNLFGIERDTAVVCLAIVNMIFRGDGKNHIEEANCFTKFLKRATVDGQPSAVFVRQEPAPGEEPVTRLLMNPPFALKDTDEKESRFIEAGLKNMADGGIQFTIVPMSVMSEGGREGQWRRDSLLTRHTLLAVVSLPEELFYPVSNQTVAVIVKKGIPHEPNRSVFWGRITRDGFVKSKGKRLPTLPGSPNDVTTIQPILRAFVANPNHPVQDVPEFIRLVPIDYTDPILELVPEAYVESVVPDLAALNRRLDVQVRENIAALVDVDLRHGTGGQSILDASRGATMEAPKKNGSKLPAFRPFALGSLFELHPGEYHSLAELDAGLIPVVSCADSGNGVIGTYDVPGAYVYQDALTITFNGLPLTTKIHPYRFAGKDDVAIAVPLSPLSPECLVFIQATLNSERWRFSCYRKCFRAKLGRLVVELPVRNGGELNTEFMESAIRAQPYWWFLKPRLAKWNPATPADQSEDEDS